MVFIATNAEGEIERVQEVHLRPDGQNKRRLDGSKIKLTRGRKLGAAVRLPAIGRGGFDTPILHAEGSETGLSAWRATGLPTQIWFGGLTMAQLAPGRAHILLADDDKAGSAADRQLEKALAGWRQAGVRVAVATPWPERRGDKSDFNDVLRTAIGPDAGPAGDPPGSDAKSPDDLSARQAAGLAAVAARIRLAELELQGLAPAPPPFPLPTADLREVRGNVARQVAHFLLHRLDEQPPRVLLIGVPGSGKTEEIGAAIPGLVITDRHQGRPHRVIVAVPMHRLGRQIIARFAGASPRPGSQPRSMRAAGSPAARDRRKIRRSPMAACRCAETRSMSSWRCPPAPT